MNSPLVMRTSKAFAQKVLEEGRATTTMKR